MDCKEGFTFSMCGSQVARSAPRQGCAVPARQTDHWCSGGGEWRAGWRHLAYRLAVQAGRSAQPAAVRPGPALPALHGEHGASEEDSRDDRPRRDDGQPHQREAADVYGGCCDHDAAARLQSPDGRDGERRVPGHDHHVRSHSPHPRGRQVIAHTCVRIGGWAMGPHSNRALGSCLAVRAGPCTVRDEDSVFFRLLVLFEYWLRAPLEGRNKARRLRQHRGLLGRWGAGSPLQL
mmetsp:Transcript_8838/g.21243  ORF Transcript_8838/g.21243 Transcript_8838/m.21243 type:complete len:234 (-) Transcript_8838:50-751(-)